MVTHMVILLVCLGGSRQSQNVCSVLIGQISQMNIEAECSGAISGSFVHSSTWIPRWDTWILR